MITQNQSSFAEMADSTTEAELRRRGGLKWATASATQIPAWVAEMDFGIAPPVSRALHELVDRGEFGYISAERIARFRHAVADWYREEYGFEVSPDDVHPLGDVVEAYRRTIDVFTPAGSPIIVPMPSYAPFVFTPQTMGREVIEVALVKKDGVDDLDLDGIDAAFAAGGRLLVLCNPFNPLGRVLSVDELRAVSEVVERHGGHVFSDEIHAPLVYTDDEIHHVSYAAVSPIAAAHSVTGFSPSKAFNLPALKTAVVITNNEEQRQRWASQGPLVNHGASIVGVVANTVALTDGRPWLNDARDYLRGNRDLVTAAVRSLNSARAVQPDATYLYWVDLGEAGVISPAETLAQNGLLVSDGAVFGEAYSQFIRLNFALPRPILERALERFAEAF